MPKPALHTRLCDLLGCRYPIIQGGMTWVSRAELVAAVSEAGCFGVLGAANMGPEELREELRRLRTLTSRPFGVNIPLVMTTTEDLVAVAVDEKLPFVVTAAGSPAVFTSTLQKAGCFVFHVTPSPRLARKCIDAGVDGLVVEGWEAGGHVSTDEITSIALGRLVREFWSGPLVVAGGFVTGEQIVAGLALGADGVQMGTRFVAVEENNAHPAYLELLTRRRPDLAPAVVYSRNYHPGRALRSPAVEKLVQMEKDGEAIEAIVDYRGRHRAFEGCIHGDLKEGIFPAGLSSGLIKEVQPVAEVVASLVGEAEACLERLAALRGKPES